MKRGNKKSRRRVTFEWEVPLPLEQVAATTAAPPSPSSASSPGGPWANKDFVEGAQTPTATPAGEAPAALPPGAAVAATAGGSGLVREVFMLQRMHEAGVQANTVTYIALVDGYMKERKLDQAEQVLQRMHEARVQADTVTYNEMVNG